MLIYFAIEIGHKSGLVTHAFNASIQEAKAGVTSFELRANLAYVIKQVPGKLGLYSETLSINKEKSWTWSLLCKCRNRCQSQGS